MKLLPLLLFLHLVAVLIWVGGMFFAHQCLRPAAVALLEPPLRLRLWRAVLARFVAWVGAAVAVILGSGLLMMASVGFAAAPWPWHLMMGLGLAMTAVFLFVVFAPLANLRRAVAREDWAAGAAALAIIRRMVGINIMLGLLTVAVATLGRMALWAWS